MSTTGTKKSGCSMCSESLKPHWLLSVTLLFRRSRKPNGTAAASKPIAQSELV